MRRFVAINIQITIDGVGYKKKITLQFLYFKGQYAYSGRNGISGIYS